MLIENSDSYYLVRYFGIHIDDSEWVGYGNTKSEVVNMIQNLTTDTINKRDIVFYKVKFDKIEHPKTL